MDSARIAETGTFAGPEGRLAPASCHKSGAKPAFPTCECCNRRSIGNITVVLLLLALVAMGCRMPRFFDVGSKDVPDGMTNSQIVETENPATAPTDDPRSDVIRASKKFLDQPHFSATMDGEGETSMHIELDYQAPDRFHMTSTLPTGRIETVIIGRDMYMKAGEKWQKMPGALGQTVPQIRQFFDEKGLESLKDVSYVGEESVEGQPAYVYSYRNEAGKGGAQYPFTSKIWVRASDGLPGKIEVDYEGGQLKTLSIVYDYDKSVSVEPPVTR